MSDSIELFSKETDVILTLISEIDEICRKNSIRYFIADDLFLLAYEQQKEDDRSENAGDEDEGNRDEIQDVEFFSDDRQETANVLQSEYNLRNGMIYMHPEDFIKFADVVRKSDLHERVLEWMGTNPDFPALYARYVDTSTVYYTALRLSTEKQLGMFITINIIRPKGPDMTRDRLKERVWRDWTMGLEPTRKKVKYSFAMLDVKASLLGKEKVARDYATKLLSHYANLHKKNGSNGKVWILKDTRIRPYIYSASLFSDYSTLSFRGHSLTAVKNLETYSFTAKKRGVSIRDNIESFCDTNIPFHELELEQFREQITSIVRFRENFIQDPEVRSKRRKWKGILRLLSRSYYRYYYGLMLLDNVDEYEEVLRTGRYEDIEKLKEELNPYKAAIISYGGVYLSDRMSKIMIELFGDSIAKKLADRPDTFDEGIKIYDYRGNYQRTIGGKND